MMHLDDIRWYHKMELPHGIITPGIHSVKAHVGRLKLPDMTGKRVLDIGAWDGGYSFEAERLGAKYVLATDSVMWTHGTKNAGFEYAHAMLESRVEAAFIPVLDISVENVGPYDVVLFLGVLYHMEHPLLSLERVADVLWRGGVAIIETHVACLEVNYPAIRYYEDKELNNDPSNWCGPNVLALMAMCRTVGLNPKHIGTFGDRAVVHATKE